MDRFIFANSELFFNLVMSCYKKYSALTIIQPRRWGGGGGGDNLLDFV